MAQDQQSPLGLEPDTQAQIQAILTQMGPSGEDKHGEDDRRLERLEQAAFSDDQNMIIVLPHLGDDEAAKVAEAKLEHGLAEGRFGRG